MKYFFLSKFFYKYCCYVATYEFIYWNILNNDAYWNKVNVLNRVLLWQVSIKFHFLLLFKFFPYNNTDIKLYSRIQIQVQVYTWRFITDKNKALITPLSNCFRHVHMTTTYFSLFLLYFDKFFFWVHVKFESNFILRHTTNKWSFTIL